MGEAVKMREVEKRALQERIFLITISMICVVFISGFVSAFALGIPPDFSMYPGQTLDSGFDIMNTYGGDITVQGRILEGSEIASFSKGSKFNVAGGSVIPAYVRYKMPSDANIGKVYTVKVIFSTVSAGEGSGSVSFGEDVARSFNIRVGEKPIGFIEEKSPEKGKVGAVFGWIIAAIIILLIIWLILRKKKKR